MLCLQHRRIEISSYSSIQIANNSHHRCFASHIMLLAGARSLMFFWFAILVIRSTNPVRCQSLNSSSFFKLWFEPSQLILTEAENETVIVNFNLSRGLPHPKRDKETLNLYAQIKNPKVAAIYSSKELTVPIDDYDDYYSSVSPYNFTIYANFVGRTTLQLYQSTTLGNKLDLPILIEQLQITVLRPPSLLQTAFAVAVTALAFVNTIVLGMQLNTTQMIGFMKKPLSASIAVVCQFTFMPVLAFAWAKLILSGMTSLQLAYFTVGCSPGGGSANFWVILLNGDLNLAVTVAVITNIVALAAMPVWIYTLGKSITLDSNINLPFTSILLSLALLIIPIGIGVLAKRWKPDLEVISRKMLKLASFLVLVAGGVLGVVANHYVFLLVTWRTVLCGLLLPWAGYVIGFFAAILFKQAPEQRITICLSTGIQKTSIAIFLVLFSLEHPDCDLAMVMPLCVVAAVPIPPALVLLTNTVNQRLHQRRALKIVPGPVIPQLRHCSGGSTIQSYVIAVSNLSKPDIVAISKQPNSKGDIIDISKRLNSKHGIVVDSKLANSKGDTVDISKRPNSKAELFAISTSKGEIVEIAIRPNSNSPTQIDNEKKWKGQTGSGRTSRPILSMPTVNLPQKEAKLAQLAQTARLGSGEHSKMKSPCGELPSVDK